MVEKIDVAIEVAKKRMPALMASADMQKAGQAVLNLMQAKAVYITLVKPTEELDEEISFVLGKVRSNLAATDLQQVTQAVLNLMQAKAQFERLAEEVQPQGTKTTKKSGASAS